LKEHVDKIDPRGQFCQYLLNSYFTNILSLKYRHKLCVKPLEKWTPEHLKFCLSMLYIESDKYIDFDIWHATCIVLRQIILITVKMREIIISTILFVVVFIFDLVLSLRREAVCSFANIDAGNTIPLNFIQQF